jgi:K+-transporting ATPase ATPase B chain
MEYRRRVSPSIIAFNAIKKINPYAWLRNPIMEIVFVAACLSLVLFLKELHLPTGHANLYAQMTFWIWATLFFSNLSEAYADSKLDPRMSAYRNKHLKIRRIIDITHPKKFKETSIKSIRSGHLILLKNGDTVPFDGIIIKGSCCVNETNITGSLDSAIKEENGDNILAAGSIIENSDYIVMKVSFAPKISFLSRIKRTIKDIKHQSLPSELALQRLILGISALFLTVIFTVWVIAKYSGFNIPLIYLIDLVVILLPTTITGLQYAVITLGKARLFKSDIIVNNPNALDNAIDINIVLLDKTGTLTIGRRQMIEFHNLSKLSDDECMRILFLSSLKDSTFEGKSIKSFAKKYGKIELNNIQRKLYKNLHFSASNPISGCDYNDLEIRKGSLKAIANYLKMKDDDLPQKITKLIASISEMHGTPLLLTLNKKIIGILHLSDQFRRGVISQINKLHEEGFEVAMITGDNSLTASYMAKKLGIKKFYAEATPEKKLNLIKELQNKGYIVAMCGDGANDSLALAQADIGLSIETKNKIHQSIPSSNLIAQTPDLTSIINLKNICKRIASRRGSLTIFSLASDITKYFIIVPALFTTAFPPLSILNFMQFHSLEGVVLSSIMFNALTILILMPILVKDYRGTKPKNSPWINISVYGIGGLIFPFIGIKLMEIFIYNVGLL